ncbi:MAG TPA: formylglycine-generating enzyme family protein [Gemmatimonadaceae bacterium]|nr:formylglycine-generating enzyme family protein [Gemmatimonadaceae bacterium]
MPRLRTLSTALLAGFLALAPAAHAVTRDGAGAAKRRVGGAAGMVRMPAGAYVPLYGRPSDPAVRVEAFQLDRDPVTRGDFLAFVRAHPEWRRGAVRPHLADRRHYLAAWRGDLDAGDATDLRRPVTGVSWFAARAYCAAQAKRLPTVAEWEYAAAASATSRDAARDRRFHDHLLALYTRRTTPVPPVEAARVNAFGVRGLHDLAWEWVEDFDGVRGSHDAHGVAGHEHDLFCASAAIGTSDPGNYPAFLRYAVRAGATRRTTMETLGFRCAL